jgi:hypothetical protein
LANNRLTNGNEMENRVNLMDGLFRKIQGRADNIDPVKSAVQGEVTLPDLLDTTRKLKLPFPLSTSPRPLIPRYPTISTPNQLSAWKLASKPSARPAARELTSGEELDKGNRAFDRLVQLIGVMGQVDSYLHERATLAGRQLLALINEEDRFRRGYYTI